MKSLNIKVSKNSLYNYLEYFNDAFIFFPLRRFSCDLSVYQTKERETKALIRASKELNCSHLLIITSNEEGEEIIKDKKIKFMPIWKWLLDSE